LIPDRHREFFSLPPSIAHPASYPNGTECSFPGGKAAGAWSLPFTSIQYRSLECVEVYIYTPFVFVVWCLLSVGYVFMACHLSTGTTLPYVSLYIPTWIGSGLVEAPAPYLPWQREWGGGLLEYSARISQLLYLLFHSTFLLPRQVRFKLH
jgi:hypothetical protein